MKLMTLGSSSAGNCYVLSGQNETLIIEAGVRFIRVKQSLNFNLSGIACCLVSHSHNDHSGYIKDFLKAGILVLSSKSVFESKDVSKYSYLCKEVVPGKGYKVGNFKILPFSVVHDVPCLGYLIDHPESGKILFITDTFMSEYTFPGLNHILLEANYTDDILEVNILNGSVHPSMRERLLNTHMELETCKGILRANDLTNVLNIVLLHLSAGNSDQERFVREIQEETGKTTYVAEAGLTIDLNINPY